MFMCILKFLTKWGRGGWINFLLPIFLILLDPRA